MKIKEFLEDIIANLDIKKVETMETFEDGEKITSLYIRLQEPSKFSVER